MNTKIIERIRKGIEKMNYFRDAIAIDFEALIKEAREEGLDSKSFAYLTAAKAEFDDFYYDEALEALDRAIPKENAMPKKDIIAQLISLRDNSSDFAKDPDADEIWHRDIEALNAAIAIIEAANIE